MKKIILLSTILLVFASCTKTSKEKHQEANRKLMITEAEASREKFKDLSRYFVMLKDKQQSKECLQYSKKDFESMSYIELRKHTVYNKHYLKIYNQNLTLLNDNLMRKSETMAKLNTKNKSY